jgi:hypothetical protein
MGDVKVCKSAFLLGQLRERKKEHGKEPQMEYEKEQQKASSLD